MANYFLYETKLGKITIEEENGFITGVVFGEVCGKGENAPSELTGKAAAQLDEYFFGMRKEFDLPLLPEGTPFQVRVWQEVQKIPYGETRSYRQIAEAIGVPKASRAVGKTNKINPILLLIPCHRVIGKSGKLVGYAAGLDLKERLLRIERINI